MVSVCISVSEVSSQVHTRCSSVCVRCVIFTLMVLHTCASVENGNRSSIDHELFAFHHEVITEDITIAFRRRNRQEPRLVMREEVCVYSDITVSVFSYGQNLMIAQRTICLYSYVSIIAFNNSHLIQVVLIWLTVWWNWNIIAIYIMVLPFILPCFNWF